MRRIERVLRFLFVCLLVGDLSTDSVFGAEPIRATIDRETAWTGEPVPIVVTLYSPGPFAGTASFELPELPNTVILRNGNPLVGSDTVDGESLMTQRHELTLYTQLVGEVVIPSFSIRFNGKKDFVSDAEPVTGKTDALKFVSKRPPGSPPGEVVLAATSMTVRESWSTESNRLEPGDVIARTIRREATGTTAMLMPPLAAEADDGVRVYDAAPTVEDRTERGASSAMRIDTLKYQFERPGTFQLPEIRLTWWDAPNEKLRSDVMPGRSIDVSGADSASGDGSTQPPGRGVWRWAVGLMACLAGLALWRWLVVQGVIASAPLNPRAFERSAASELRGACRANLPEAAYAALLVWKQANENASPDQVRAAEGSETQRRLEREIQNLAERLYGDASGRGPWSGESLAAALADYRRLVHQRSSQRTTHFEIPPLNAS